MVLMKWFIWSWLGNWDRNDLPAAEESQFSMAQKIKPLGGFVS